MLMLLNLQSMLLEQINLMDAVTGASYEQMNIVQCLPFTPAHSGHRGSDNDGQ